MTQYMVWVKRSLDLSFTGWWISFQLFAFSSQKPSLPRCLISFKYRLRTVSLFSRSVERDTKWPRAWRERRSFLLGLQPSFGARVRALPSLIGRKRETARRLFLLGLFSLNSCKVAFFSCSDVDTPDCAALKLIDFGRSIDMKLFPTGTTFSANCYTEDFQCIEMKEGRAWTTQVPLTSATWSARA